MIDLRDYVMAAFGVLFATLQYLLKREVARNDAQIKSLEAADREHYEKLTSMLSVTRVLENKIAEQTGQFREIITHQNEKIELMIKPIATTISEIKEDLKNKADNSHVRRP
jgi:hypothetical protein